MKTDGLKKLIKEAVREAIQEELKDILLEAVRTPKTPIGVGGYGTTQDVRTKITSIAYHDKLNKDRRVLVLDR